MLLLVYILVLNLEIKRNQERHAGPSGGLFFQNRIFYLRSIFWLPVMNYSMDLTWILLKPQNQEMAPGKFMTNFNQT